MPITITLLLARFLFLKGLFPRSLQRKVQPLGIYSNLTYEGPDLNLAKSKDSEPILF